MLLLGLFSWILIGAVAGVSARLMLPGTPPLGWGSALLAGVGGALVGGLVATVLGFGGLAGFDVRAFVVATLASVLLIVALRTYSLAT